MSGMGGAGVDAGISDHEKKTIQMVCLPAHGSMRHNEADSGTRCKQVWSPA